MNIYDFINAFDVEQQSKSFQNAKPFPNMMIDNFLKEDFANSILEAIPDYNSLAKTGASYTSVNENGKVQVTDSKTFSEPVSKLNQVLASQEFLDLISKISGIDKLLADEELVGGGIHQTGPRGILDVHVDFNYIESRKLHRRLNILIYLNKDWPDSWGGAVELWDEKVQKCHHSFSPIFNRCVVFATNDISYHGVTAVKCPQDTSRKSFAAYYYTKEAPPEWTGEAHSTIFRARPDEKYKKYVAMPLQSFRGSVRERINSGKKQVKNILGITS